MGFLVSALPRKAPGFRRNETFRTSAIPLPTSAGEDARPHQALPRRGNPKLTRGSPQRKWPPQQKSVPVESVSARKRDTGLHRRRQPRHRSRTREEVRALSRLGGATATSRGQAERFIRQRNVLSRRRCLSPAVGDRLANANSAVAPSGTGNGRERPSRRRL